MVSPAGSPGPAESTSANVTPSRRPASVSKEDRAVQIAAAKARVTIDRRLGVRTEDWIIALSMEKPE